MTQQEALFEYCLRLGDTSLILGQRISEWCGHAPYLEEDIAMSNIALDLIGQARIILNYAGEVEGKGRDEDTLAFHRDTRQYRNLLMAEQPNGDFAMTIGRQYLLSTFNFHLYSQLSKSKDSTIAAFAAKSLKEVAYHVRHSADWVLRLGDGTEESHGRMQNAIDDLWYFTADLFDADQVDDMLTKAGIAADLGLVEKSWRDGVAKTLNEAGLTTPGINTPMRNGSRKGNHTEHLGFILAEMQFLPRAYPDAKW
jgi:ring-1,2-phenylacetyl-CoA epoxidase subunit PaaC